METKSLSEINNTDIKMKVTCIGSGGAFDYEEPNSSFVCERGIGTPDYKCILIDCGYNIFSELRKNYEELLNSITHIYITHMDDDHIGSLKTLLYYRHFMTDAPTVTIVTPTDIQLRDNLRLYLSDINKTYKGSEFTYSVVFKWTDSYNTLERITQMKAIHHITCYGILIKEKHSKSGVLISGDSKATSRFEDAVKGVVNPLVFLDYSNWNAPSRNVHACKADTEIEYSEEFRKKAIFYHNKDAKLAGTEWVLCDDTWYKILK